MKHLFFLLLIFIQLNIKAAAENILEPREHSPVIDPAPSRLAERLIHEIIKLWQPHAGFGYSRIRTIYNHPDHRYRSWRLDFQGPPETFRVQYRGRHGMHDVRFERYAVQGGRNDAQTFSVVHIQEGIRFGQGLIREAFEQSARTQSHVFLSDSDIEAGLNFPTNDGNDYSFSSPIRRRWNREDVWRMIWGTATAVEAIRRRIHIGPRIGHDKENLRRGLEDDDDEEENWKDNVYQTMANCINAESDKSIIGKNAHTQLKEIYPEDNPDITPQYIEKLNSVLDNAGKTVKHLQKFESNHNFDEFVAYVQTIVPFSYILLVHDKADLRGTFDADDKSQVDQYENVNHPNKGHGQFWYFIGIEGAKTSEQDKMVMKEKMLSSTDSISEPTGESTVPAHSCGKRIVGYYTAWGKREITENQLKKLTHIIYAFIEMSADGKIKFGGAAEDFKPGENPAEITKKRFLDMINKARKVNSGIKILIAIGGWSNSQHFSSVAADAGKRNTFVTEISNFLKEYKIDGVDIDWEYPVTGGANEGIKADKAHYVILMKKLRAKGSSRSDVSKKPEIFERIHPYRQHKPFDLCRFLYGASYLALPHPPIKMLTSDLDNP